jgi:formate dehydrogenase major subunit
MISLTIDGRQVSVPPGTTVLDAARQLDIRIPTLCHVPGLEPASSCFVCAVQVKGNRSLSPSCAMPAAEGMEVDTNSEAVRGARRVAIELLLSDHAGECVAPCSARCPAGLDIPGFVREIVAGDVTRSMSIISERLALPGALGRICPRLCEQGCRRIEYDDGLTIGPLHRYVADLDREAAEPYAPPRASSTGKSVAIVGAGPAGLSAAQFLLRQGHACTLFDAESAAGGMLRYGIPAFRLPKDALDAEIDEIRRAGAEFRMNTRWGRDFRLAELRANHDAVFLAVGAQRAQELRCEGEELALSGVEFLRLVAEGNPPSLGADVVVLGGGNTAMDCARAAIRLGPRSVRILYRRTRREMPCLMQEVEEAEAEGVVCEMLVAPTLLERGDDHQLLLTCQHTMLGAPDASGRCQPVPVEGSEYVVECSTVIAAIGQAVDRSLAESEGLRVTGWGIAADERTLATNLPGVFAGGDAVLGADLAVRAVAAGRIAAASIGQFLRGEPVAGEARPAAVVFRPVDDAERALIFRGIEMADRVPMPEIEMERRLAGFEEVATGLSGEDARREAQRCLTCGCRKSDCCGVRTLATEYGADAGRFAGERRRFSQDTSHPDIIYEPGKCIMCDACVRIAAEAGEPLGLTTIGRGFNVTVAAPFGQPMSEALLEVALRCAETCPSGALALRSASGCGLGACGGGQPGPSHFPIL